MLKESERYQCLRQALEKLTERDRETVTLNARILTRYVNASGHALSEDGSLLVLAAIGKLLNGK